MGKIVAFDYNVGDEVYVKSKDMNGTVYGISFDNQTNGNDPASLTRPLKETVVYKVKTENGFFGTYAADDLWFPEFKDKLQWNKEKAVLRVVIDACLDNGNKEMFNTYTKELAEIERKEKELENKTP